MESQTIYRTPALSC